MKQNSKWKAKSKVVLDYELKHMNKELDEWLTCWRGAPGGFKSGVLAGLGRPA
jgi:hypothetical protein